jgi:hypothetical protein
MLDIFRICPQYSQENAGVVIKTSSRGSLLLFSSLLSYNLTMCCDMRRAQLNNSK